MAYTIEPSLERGDPRAVTIELSDHENIISMHSRYMSEFAADWTARTLKVDQGGTTWIQLRLPLVNTETITASPNGRYVATADLSRNIRLWDLEAPDTDWRASGHTWRVMHLQFTTDGSRLITIGKDRVVKHWRVETGEELKRSLMPDPGTTEYWLCTSGSGDRVLLCPLKTFGGRPYHTFNGCYVWDVNRSKVLFDGRALGGGDARATSLGSCNHRVPKLSSDGRYLFEAVPPYQNRGQGEVEDEVVVWDLASSRVHRRLRVRGVLRATAPHPDGTIYSLTSDKGWLYLQAWNPTDGECLSTRDLISIRTAQGGDASRDTAGNYDLGFTPNGRFAVILFMSDVIPFSSCRYDLKTGRMHPGASDVTPDGRYALSLGSRKPSLPEFARTKSLETKHWTLKITDVANQIVTAIPVTLGDRDDQVPVRWSVDGQTMFTANVDSTLTCWDARTGQERVTFQTGLQRITRMEVSPRGDAVALADERGGVAVLRASLPTDLTDRRLLGRSGSEP